jgi:hypothetical protein
VKADGISLALQDDDLGIIAQPLARHAAEIGRGAHERAPQRIRRQVQHQLGPALAGVGQDDHEEVKRPAPSRDLEMADLGPVKLGLFPDERCGPDKHLAPGKGTVLAKIATQRAEAAGVATRA